MRKKSVIDTNDDLVLECAEQIRDSALNAENFQRFVVLLITNDRNLGLKTLVAELHHLTGFELARSPEEFISVHIAD
jgi:hypothetical protein